VTGGRAWGWVQHLRDGGTTSWADWTGTADPSGAVVPGAQQLELLRRINEAHTPTPHLVDRVLAASAPGRGQPDLELLGAVEETPFGPRPVDPANLPLGELLRVAAGLLAEDVVGRGLPRPAKQGRPRPWRRSYRLHGDPELVDPIRAHLVARGRPPGGRDSVHLIVVSDLGLMLAHLWTTRAFGAKLPGWRVWLRTLRRNGGLPGRIDPLATARALAGQAPPHRIHIVLDQDALPSLVGVRRLPDRPPELAAAAPDLARRISSYAGLLVPAEQRRALMRRTLRPRLVAVDGPALALPVAHREWLEDHADRIAEEVRRAGYAVHGDLAGLAPVRRPGVAAPDPRETLALAMRMLTEET
jgi:hypothetical protein